MLVTVLCFGLGSMITTGSFPGRYFFINSPSAHIVFERSIDGKCYNPSGTSDGQCNNNISNIFIERNCRFIIQTTYSFRAVIEAQETEKEIVM